MPGRLSRRKIASYCAERLAAGDQSVLDELAALIVDENRQRETPLIVRDIEGALSGRGIVVADVAAARTVSADVTAALEQLVRQKTGAKTVHFRPSVDPDLIGGVRLNLPGSELDTTIRRRLTTLKATKLQ